MIFLQILAIPKELGGTIVETYCKKNITASKLVIS